MTLRAGCRNTTRTRLVGSTVTVFLGGLVAGAAPVMAVEHPVGHDVQRIVVPDSATTDTVRQVDVHLWYPADPATVAARPKTVYRSALHGVAVPAPYTPLAWTVEADSAREDAAIAPAGKPFGVIVFSHGNTNDPIDYAPTLERIAAGGFVVAAPAHTGNTQDDTRIDALNALPGAVRVPCNDGRAGPCSRTNVPFSMADRTRDVSKVLDAVGGWFGTRVDVAQVGLLGHSRGTLTALATAGGSAAPQAGVPCSGDPVRCWPLSPDPRVVAVMGMAIGQPAISLGVDYASIRVPTLLVSASDDLMSPPSVSERAMVEMKTNPDKRLVSVPKGVHRTFDSNYCAELRAAGLIAAADANAVLDKHTFDRIAVSPNSGWGVDYCPFATFTGIEALTRDVTGGFTPTPANVPRTGVDTDTVKVQMAQLAVEFFGTRLGRAGSVAVQGTVPATLALTLSPPASFGTFLPGVDGNYDAGTTATVLTTSSALLSISDPSLVAPGRLVNGSYALDQPLQVRANGAAFGPLGPVLSYAGPVSHDVATIDFRQSIARTQPLRTGVYAKTLTFTLSTSSP